MENLEKGNYKLALVALKLLPMIAALIYGCNSLLAYFDIHLEGLGYVVRVLFIITLLIFSKLFRFCFHHRVFLYYVLANDALNIVDFYWGIPVSNRGMFLIYVVLTCVALFLFLYGHQKHIKSVKESLCGSGD